MAGRVLFSLWMFVGVCVIWFTLEANGNPVVRKSDDNGWSSLASYHDNDDSYELPTVKLAPSMVIAQIDLYQYKQEEINVELRDMTIYVKGRHVTKVENGYDASEFERFYAVPEGVSPEIVSTRYTDGMLKIEATRLKRESQPRKIAGGEIVSDDEKFEIVLDVRNYKPDEIEVKVNGDDLIVTGKQETEENGRRITRQFTRNFKVPHDVNVRTVNSRVSVDGYLYVYARKETSSDEESYKYLGGEEE